MLLNYILAVQIVKSYTKEEKMHTLSILVVVMTVFVLHTLAGR